MLTSTLKSDFIVKCRMFSFELVSIACVAMLFLGSPSLLPAANGSAVDKVESASVVKEKDLSVFGIGIIPDLPESMLQYCVCLPAYSPDHKRIAFCANGKAILNVYSVASKKIVWSFHLPTEQIWRYSWSPDGKFIAVGSDQAVSVLDGQSGKLKYKLENPVRVADVQWSPDGTMLAAIDGAWKSLEESEKVRIWSTRNHNCVGNIPQVSGNRIEWAPDSSRIAFNSGGVEIWDVKSMVCKGKLKLPRTGFHPISWSPDGRYIVIADMMTTILYICDTTSGALIGSHTLPGDMQGVENIAWLPNNKIRCLGLCVYSWSAPIDRSGKFPVENVTFPHLGEEGYVPKNIEECMIQLDAQLPQHTKAAIESGRGRQGIIDDIMLGTWIRNSWGLRNGSELMEYFFRTGCKHPEQMSAKILDRYREHLHEHRSNSASSH